MEITPFTVAVSDADVADLQSRLANTRWPVDVVSDWSRGVPTSYARNLAETWATSYDWRAQEARLNSFPQFTATIDGQLFHFVHVRSNVAGATPLLLAHGYPSSFVEFTRMIESLVDPEAHGGRPEDAFHVVIPSLPGFGFSAPPVPGWGIQKSANAFDQIMQALGYERYGVSGGDVGAGISAELGLIAGERMIGALVVTDPGAIATEYTPPTDHLTEDEQARHAELKAARARGLRLHRAPDDAAAVDRLRPDRLAGRPADLDRREGPGMDRSGQGAPGGCGRPRPPPHPGERVLVQPRAAPAPRTSCTRPPTPQRPGARPTIDRKGSCPSGVSRSCAGSWIPKGDWRTGTSTTGGRRARCRRALPGDGGPRPLRRRRAGVLRGSALTYRPA